MSERGFKSALLTDGWIQLNLKAQVMFLSSSRRWWLLSSSGLTRELIYPVSYWIWNVENKSWMGPSCAGSADSLYGIETRSPKAGPRMAGQERRSKKINDQKPSATIFPKQRKFAQKCSSPTNYNNLRKHSRGESISECLLFIVNVVESLPLFDSADRKVSLLERMRKLRVWLFTDRGRLCLA